MSSPGRQVGSACGSVLPWLLALLLLASPAMAGVRARLNDGHGWGPWRELDEPAGIDAVAVPARVGALLGLESPPVGGAWEMEWSRRGEERDARRSWLWSTPSPPAWPRRVAPAAAPSKRASVQLQGRLLYADRVYGLEGYTGAVRRLPLRHLHLELRRSADDSLLVAGATGADGSFALAADLALPSDLSLVLRSRGAATAPAPAVVLEGADAAGDTTGYEALRRTAVEVLGAAPGQTLDLGEILLQDGGGGDPLAAFNLLDCLLDALDLWASPDGLGAAPPDPPVLVWSPDLGPSSTRVDGDLIRVASPAGGDDDAWADPVVLAAISQWLLQTRGRVDAVASAVDLALPDDPRAAFGRGAALALACAVRAHRAAVRVDADGLPADDDVSVWADLGPPPPPGFPSLAQDGLDLEDRRRAFGQVADPHGQRSAANVAAMIWDLQDDLSTADLHPGDDDPRNATVERGTARCLALLTLALPALDEDEPITYEDLHLAWLDAYFGQQAALTDVAVEQGRTALYADAFEPDPQPADVATVPVWVQPEPPAGGGVVLGEVDPGLEDAVEVTNASRQVLSVGGWRVVARRNGFSTGPEREAVLPEGTVIPPGRSLVVHEGGDAIQDGPSDVHPEGWSAPWREGADGACILYDQNGTAVDFVRWDGDEASAEPVPAGLVFSGSLSAPAFGEVLARDSLATDTDQAADFQPARPTPSLPNAAFFTERSLYPAGDEDHARAMRVEREREVVTVPWRESPRMRVALLDPSGAVELEAGPSASRPERTRLVLEDVATESSLLRLSPVATSLIAASVGWGVWAPYAPLAIEALEAFTATPLWIDPDLDTVHLQWLVTQPLDSLVLRVDGEVRQVLDGATSAVDLPLAAGHRRLDLEPWQAGAALPSATTGVYVGFAPCARQVDAGLPFSTEVQSEGWALWAWAPSDTTFLDRPLPHATAAEGDEAVLTVSDPVDLTSDARLVWRQAVHLDAAADALVEITFDDGTSWQELARYAADDPSLPAGADWSDDELTADDWVEESLDLSFWEGRRARIRLRRRSLQGEASLGWTVQGLRLGAPLSHRVWVDPAGDDLFGCGHPEHPVATAARAAALSAPGDTLRLRAGVYGTGAVLEVEGEPREVQIPLPPGRSVRGEGPDLTEVVSGGEGIGLLASTSLGWTAGDSARVSGVTFTGGATGLRVEAGALVAAEVDLRGGGLGVAVVGGALRLENALVRGGGPAGRVDAGALHLVGCTVADLPEGITVGAGADSARIERTLFARCPGPLVVVEPGGPEPLVACCDFWGLFGNEQPFVGMPDPRGGNSNLQVDPLFCDAPGGDYALSSLSPLLEVAGCGRVGARGEGCPEPAVEAPSLRPASTGLRSVQPNPFNPRTTIVFATAARGPVRLEIYDVRGRRIRTLVDGFLEAGEHRSHWDGRDGAGRSVASGVYHLRLRAGSQVDSRGLLLLK